MHRVKTNVSGTTIGLLGGSFDPPHKGHLHITHQALRAFDLDQIWWVVSSGNPLKGKPSLSMLKRLEACSRIANYKKIYISDIELGMKTPFSSDIICALYHRYPGARFVWLMGADNLISFHRWQNWSWIMENIPIGVLPRPGKQIRAGLSLAARRYQRYRLKTHEAKFLSRRRAPAWLLLTGSMIDISSTNIRSDEL